MLNYKHVDTRSPPRRLQGDVESGGKLTPNPVSRSVPEKGGFKPSEGGPPTNRMQGSIPDDADLNQVPGIDSEEYDHIYHTDEDDGTFHTDDEDDALDLPDEGFGSGVPRQLAVSSRRMAVSSSPSGVGDSSSKSPGAGSNLSLRDVRYSSQRNFGGGESV